VSIFFRRAHMGVKGLVSWFHGVAIDSLTPCDALYIDVMALLHAALTPAFLSQLQTVPVDVAPPPATPKGPSYQRRNKRSARGTHTIPPPAAGSSAAPKDMGVDTYLRNVTTILERTLTLAPPSRLLYVAFDGASVAKVPEKRRRRLQYKGVGRWWRGALTPGTMILDEVAAHVQQWAHAYAAAQSIELFFSGPWSLEEAEVKIARHLAAHPPSGVAAVVSTDSDIFLLGLVSQLESLYFFMVEVKPSTLEVSLKPFSIDRTVRAACYGLHPSFEDVRIPRPTEADAASGPLPGGPLRPPEGMAGPHATSSPSCSPDVSAAETALIRMDVALVLSLTGSDILPHMLGLTLPAAWWALREWYLLAARTGMTTPHLTRIDGAWVGLDFSNVAGWLRCVLELISRDSSDLRGYWERSLDVPTADCDDADLLELLYAAVRQLNVYRGVRDVDPAFVFQTLGAIYPLEALYQAVRRLSGAEEVSARWLRRLRRSTADPDQLVTATCLVASLPIDLVTLMPVSLRPIVGSLSTVGLKCDGGPQWRTILDAIRRDFDRLPAGAKDALSDCNAISANFISFQS
jgi:hypothetical protein